MFIVFNYSDDHYGYTVAFGVVYCLDHTVCKFRNFLTISVVVQINSARKFAN